MTTSSHQLGRPPSAAARGGDCRARDLAQGVNVFGPHRFAEPQHARLANGLLRVTVGPAGGVPTLTVEAFRPAVTVGDYLVDVLSDVLGGTTSTPEWVAMGTVAIGSPAVSAVLTGVRLTKAGPGGVTLRLLVSALGDVLVTLRRGEPMVRAQHGGARPLPVVTDRSVTWTGPPAIDGSSSPGRIEELVPTVEGYRRFVCSHHPVAIGSGFELVASSTESAVFGVGVGADIDGRRVADLHSQLADASTTALVVA